ncbi:Glutamate/aspartate periplasmic-binding protein precursor [compost metagenome]
MLESGRAIAFMQDDALLAGEMAKAKQPENWLVTGTPQSNELYGCTMRQGDPVFKKVVDDAIKSLFVSGEINAIYNKWFTQPIPPKGLNLKFPMSTALKAIIAKPSDQPALE